jgi:hypothetical protein
MATRFFGIAIVMLALPWACDDGGRSSGGSGSGSGSGASTGNDCQVDTFCFLEGETCTPPGCCPCSMECRNGRWAFGACPDCAAPTCPFQPPQDGEACDSCLVPTVEECSYELCGAEGFVTARCLLYGESPDGEWQVTANACEPAPPCGPNPTDAACPAGQICVQAEITTGPSSMTTYGCYDNPCSPLPSNCECAQPLCAAANAPLCTSVTPQLVQCSNGAQ